MTKKNTVNTVLLSSLFESYKVIYLNPKLTSEVKEKS